MRFGTSIGEEVWEECNRVFDRLPLAAVIDHDIFCVHGGFPRPIREHETTVQAILAVPKVAGITPPYTYETEWQQQVATDCIWSDPAREEQEARADAQGFAPSLRGGECVCFGMRAIENFLESNGLSFIVRAHEAHAHGVSLSKAAK
jgi:diadenosine tetraphosphatase ApaH/serine/threonine PP2A family protein phosphatase